MSNTSDDLRTLRTRKKIREALHQLVEAKGFSNISITDISARAGINRGTFYLHYRDKYDLLEKTENEIIEEIANYMRSADVQNIFNLEMQDKPFPFIQSLFEYLKENGLLIKALLGPKGDPVFPGKLKSFIEANLFKQTLSKELSKETALIPSEYLLAYLLSAYLGVVEKWLEGGMEQSSEEMAMIITRMFFLGPFRASGLDSSNKSGGMV
jgi:AcrR family transcriptional regulator